MKKLRTLQGGYPRQQDLILDLQSELLSVSDALFAKLGVDMVLKGCEVTDNGNGTVNIAAGILFVGSEVVRFDGASNVASNLTKTFVKGAATTSTPKVFGDGQSKDIYTEVKAEIADKTLNNQIAIRTGSLYSLADYINDVVASYAIKGEFKDIFDIDGDFLTNFDESGLGITPRYNNWAIVNGNNGTPEGAGRVRVTSGSFVAPITGAITVFNHGDRGGEVTHKLTLDELPKHKPTFKHGKSKRGTTGSEELLDLFSQAFTLQGLEIGGDQAHNNLQPYIAVYTIMKIA